ncbi:DUF5819 family protein [Corallococcus terminator]|uniref:DUF5819 family protein n=1 Tax=Corallococcus terminator TaxID=2316733 RepID=UPI0011C3F38E|nr:DUF5819 family protein [Corallococcus terminator]
MKFQQLGQALQKVLPAVLLFGLGIHFAFTLAFLTPINPVKVSVLGAVNRYMQPFFYQRWTLFAPDVEAKTRHVFVACRGEDAAGVSREEPWVNVTSPLLDLKQRYRLTPADRLERAQVAGLSQLTASDDEITTRLLEKPEDTDAYRQAVAAAEGQRQQRKQQGRRLLGRVASAACTSLYPQLRTREVRVRMATIKAPAFSQRMNADAPGDTTWMELSWQPMEAVEAR